MGNTDSTSTGRIEHFHQKINKKVLPIQEKIQTKNLIQSLPNDHNTLHITQQPWFLTLISDFVQPVKERAHTWYIPLHMTLGIWQPYIPPFMQKIETAECRIEEWESILQTLKQKYACGHICLSSDIDIKDLKMEKQKRINYVLPLHQPYDELYRQYHKGHKLNIKSAIKNSVAVSTSLDIQSFIESYQRYSHKAIPSKYKSPEKLYAVLQACMDRGHGIILQAQNKDKITLAACFLTNFKDRFIYHLSFASDEGKEKYAMHAILDQLIREHAHSNKILDFEGSMIPGVAYFMKGFGALEESYYNYEWNESLLCKIKNILRNIKSIIFK